MEALALASEHTQLNIFDDRCLTQAPGLSESLHYRSSSAINKLGEFFDELEPLVNLSHLSKGIEIRHRSARQKKLGHFSSMSHLPVPRRPTLYTDMSEAEINAKIERYNNAVDNYNLNIEQALQRPEILVVSHPKSTVVSLRMSVYHEVGHALDWIEGVEKRWEGTYTTAAGRGTIEREFIAKAKNAQSLDRAMKDYSRSERQYFLDPIEIWARAFAQWAAIQAETRLPKTYVEHRFDETEMIELSPLIESVLAAKGLLNISQTQLF